MDVNIFNNSMMKHFVDSMQTFGQPADVDAFVTTIDSKSRLENYPWMSPTPALARYIGSRRLGSISSTNYSVENQEFDKSFAVKLRDIEDDRVGGFDRKVANLVDECDSPFKSRFVLETLSGAESIKCFDGTNFFATSHAAGGSASAINVVNVTYTGGNIMTYTTPTNNGVVNDGVHHCFFMLFRNKLLDPLFYQLRKKPKMDTNSGSPQSREEKEIRYWVDMEAAVGFGYWWDALLVKIVGTPIIGDIYNCIDAARQIVRQFQLPKGLASDPAQYPHAQIKFSPENTTLASSVGIETLLDYAINQPTFGLASSGVTGIQPNALYYKKFNLIHSPYIVPT